MRGRHYIRWIGALASALFVVVGLAPGSARGQFGRIAQVGENEQYVDKQHDYKLIQPRKWYIFRLVDTSLADVGRAWMQDQLTVIATSGVAMDKPYRPNDIALLKFIKEKDREKVVLAEQRRDVRVIGGMKAAWIETSGRGVGISLKEDGSVPTKQVWVLVPREKDAVGFVLSASEATYDRALSDFKKMLKTVEIGGKQTKAQAAVPAVDPDADEPDEIDHQAEKELAQAETLRKAGKYAEALKAYDQVGIKYAARKAGKTANERARELREDPAVFKVIQQAEQDAKDAAAAEGSSKWLATAREMAKAKNYDLARRYYQKILDKYPGTKTAKTAEDELKKLPE